MILLHRIYMRFVAWLTLNWIHVKYIQNFINIRILILYIFAEILIRRYLILL